MKQKAVLIEVSDVDCRLFVERFDNSNLEPYLFSTLKEVKECLSRLRESVEALGCEVIVWHIKI